MCWQWKSTMPNTQERKTAPANGSTMPGGPKLCSSSSSVATPSVLTILALAGVLIVLNGLGTRTMA